MKKLKECFTIIYEKIGMYILLGCLYFIIFLNTVFDWSKEMIISLLMKTDLTRKEDK